MTWPVKFGGVSHVGVQVSSTCRSGMFAAIWKDPMRSCCQTQLQSDGVFGKRFVPVDNAVIREVL